MARYYLTGGRQRMSRFVRREEWNAFEKAVLLELDTDTGSVDVLLEYEGPPDRVPARDPSHIFKSASWDGELLLLCTQTEVLRYDPAARRVVEVLSHPWFNDVHHVTRLGARLHVVSTGLDAVLELDERGEVVELHSATGASPWTRFDRDEDYRKVLTTKPHQCHPNFAFGHAGVRYVTRFEQGDAWPLDAGAPALPVAADPIHDGVVARDLAWFTVVSGVVVGVDPRTGETRARHDLNRIGDDDAPLGWCRGLTFEEDRVLVGFSRLRPTRFKQNLGWLRGALARPEPVPTRVVAYDLEAGRELQSWPLEGHGMNAVFSILRADP